MKRAAVLFIVAFSLVLAGHPSTPLYATVSSGKHSYRATTAASAGDNVLGGGPAGGDNDENGGNSGDADGLSGNRGRLPQGCGAVEQRVTIVLQTWWRFFLWMR